MTTAGESRALPYTAPFLAYIGLMIVEKYVALSPFLEYTLRIFIVTAIVLTVSRPVLRIRIGFPAWSVIVGLLVFLIWIGPDFLIANYRNHWLFSNPVTGSPESTLPEDLKIYPLFLVVRSLGSFILVPVIEELFWRAWLMRWLIDSHFERVPVGTYRASSFWIVAALFALEHGPYWEVGLLAGIVYNWWMVQTKSLGDCILAHAVTNGVLAAYVIWLGHWQYWL
jgi:CAAX prenyl protease-like protein